MSQRRDDVQTRVRKAHATLQAARALLKHEPPLRDDAVNRASAAALQAARALVESQWARDSQPAWDPSWRPGMPKPGMPKDPLSAAAVQKLLERFEVLAARLGLGPDFTDYVRTLVEDGLDADFGEAPGYDEDEALQAIETAGKLVFTVAAQVGLGDEVKPGAPPPPAAAPAVVPSEAS